MGREDNSIIIHSLKQKIMKIYRLITLLVALFMTSANAQTEVKPSYYPELRSGITDMSIVRANISELFKKNSHRIWPYWIYITDQKNKLTDKPDNILVLEDRIEFKLKRQNTIIYFSDLLCDNIIEVKLKTVTNNTGGVFAYAYILLGNFEFGGNGGNIGNEPIKQLADDLFFIQYHLNEERYSSQLTLFRPIAARYRVLNVKPPVSEEQRKYIVQANLFNKVKQYTKAIELYKKAIEVDQTAYSAAYSNLALLSAQINKFDAAIYYMKKYLMLEPESPDARSSQDKIYEWELKL
jgi:tetratricopeptide (TPR) repeat protein